MPGEDECAVTMLRENALYKHWISCIWCLCVCFCIFGAASHHLSPVCIFYFPVIYFLHQSFASAMMDWVLKVSDGMHCKCMWLLLSWVWVREIGLSLTNTMFHLTVPSIIRAGPPAASSTSSFSLESHYFLQSDSKKKKKRTVHRQQLPHNIDVKLYTTLKSMRNLSHFWHHHSVTVSASKVML